MVRGPSRAWAASLLQMMLLLAVSLGGCLGAGPDVAPDPVDRTADPGTDPPSPATGGPLENPLPIVRLDARLEPPHVALYITLEGDPAAISHHALDWGDGTPPKQGEGPPETRQLRNYPAPPTWTDPPRHYTPKLTITSATGHLRSATTQLTIDPPPNLPPTAQVRIEAPGKEIPVTVQFLIDAKDRDGTLETWRFDPGDGSGIQLETGRPPEQIAHTYRQVGIHTANLTLTDDGGATNTIQTELQILPPQSHRHWTHNATTASLHDANGTVRDTHELIAPCSSAPCPMLRGAGTTDTHFLALVDQADDPHLRVLDGTDGTTVRNVSLPPVPQSLFIDPIGHAWTTHPNGTVARTDPETRRQVRLQVPTSDPIDHLVFDPDGTAWALESGPPAQLHHLDAEAGRSDLLILPAGRAAQHLTVNTKHRAAVVLDDDAQVWIAMPTLYGPRLGALVPLQGGGDVTGIACPTGRDTCWATLGGSEPRLVAIDIKTATTTPWTAPAQAPLPDGLQYGAPAAIHDQLLVPVHGAGSGYLVIDPTSGQLLHRALRPGDDPAPRGAIAVDSHPTLVYHLQGNGTLGILDLKIGRIVHRADSAGGSEGPYPVRAT